MIRGGWGFRTTWCPGPWWRTTRTRTTRSMREPSEPGSIRAWRERSRRAHSRDGAAPAQETVLIPDGEPVDQGAQRPGKRIAGGKISAQPVAAVAEPLRLQRQVPAAPR